MCFCVLFFGCVLVSKNCVGLGSYTGNGVPPLFCRGRYFRCSSSFFIIGLSDPDFRSLCSTVVARVMLGASIMCLESVCPLLFCVGSSVPGFRPLLYSAEMLGASIMCPGVFLFPFDFCVGSSDPSFRPLLSSSVFFCLLSRCSSLPLVGKSREFLISHE